MNIDYLLNQTLMILYIYIYIAQSIAFYLLNLIKHELNYTGVSPY